MKLKKFLGVLLALLAALLVQPVFPFVKSISGRGVRRARRRYINANL